MTSTPPTSCRTFDLEIECEPYQVKEVTRAILHTIMFHRCLIQSMPVDVNLKIVDVTFSKCDHAFLDSDVEQAINQLYNLFDTSSPIPQTIELIFYERKERKSWFFKAPHENPWERWRLRLKPHFPSETEDRSQSLRYLERQLKATLLYISSEALASADEIPGLSGSGKPYAYKILIQNGSPESLVGILRRMVTDTSAAPPLLG